MFAKANNIDSFSKRERQRETETEREREVEGEMRARAVKRRLPRSINPHPSFVLSGAGSCS